MIRKEPRRLLFAPTKGKAAIGLVAVGLVYLFGTTVAQQPLPSKDLGPPVQLPPLPPTVDYKNDPLYQEIHRIYLNGSNSLAQPPSGPPRTSTNSEPRVNSISNARWHAVESILAAARTLETEVTDRTIQNDVPSATKTQAAIDILRGQALELLNVPPR